LSLRKAIASIQETIARRNAEGDPSATQTRGDIAAYYGAAAIGDTAVVKETYYGVLKFRYAKIENVKGPRVYLDYDRSNTEASQNFERLCVPKTLSELMEQWNRLSWRNDRATLFRCCRPDIAFQVEVAA